MKTAEPRDFIPNISTANEEIARLDARILELEAQVEAKNPSTTANAEAPKQQAATATVGGTQLTGVHRAIHAASSKK